MEITIETEQQVMYTMMNAMIGIIMLYFGLFYFLPQARFFRQLHEFALELNGVSGSVRKIFWYRMMMGLITWVAIINGFLLSLRGIIVIHLKPVTNNEA